MKCAQTLEVGVYVLGALSPAERDAFERHLSECAVCREEVAELAVLPGLLGRLDAKTAMAVARDGEASTALLGGGSEAAEEPPGWAGPTAAAGWAGPTATTEPNVADQDQDKSISVPGTAESSGATATVDRGRWAGPTAGSRQPVGPSDTGSVAAGSENGSNVVSLLEAAKRRRAREKRRRGFMTAATVLAAACLALVVGFGAPFLIGDNRPAGPAGPGGPAWTAMNRVGGTVPVIAELALEPQTSGTKVIMRCMYEGTGAGRWTFRLVVVPMSGGSAQELSSWSASHGDRIQVEATTPLNTTDIDRVELLGADGTVLLVHDR